MKHSLREKTFTTTKNIPSSDGGKNSVAMKKSSLMKKKEEEHDAIFEVKTNHEKTASRLLTDATKELKKAKKKKVLKDAGVNLMKSGIEFSLYGQEVFKAQEQTKDVKKSAQILKAIVSFMNQSKKTISSLHLDTMEREDYEKSKSNIIGLSKNMAENMHKGIIKSELKKYGLQTSTKKYEAKLKKLIKTMESFESEHSDRMPLMGIEGAS